jgi:cytochrome c2
VSRHAVLIAIALVVVIGCTRPSPSSVAARGGCTGCHEEHYVNAGSCESCHRGNPDASRKELAHDRLIRGRAAQYRLASNPAVREGERRVGQLACRRCHTIGNTGNRLATSLDRAVWKRDQSELERSIHEPVESMPRFALSATQTEEVVAYLLHGASPAAADPGYQVRFARRGGASGSKFDEHCGGCHRALLADGPAGRGSAGPNLSGLFTEYHPPTAPENKQWVAESLRDWLRNPRAFRSRTSMRPVQLDAGEWSGLVAELTVEIRVE